MAANMQRGEAGHMSSLLPAIIERHLDAIQIWDDGTTCMASSNLTGRYWNGSVWCFRTAEDIPAIEKCITGVETDSGVCDMVALGQNQVLIGLDSGAVEVLGLEVEHSVLSSVMYRCEHNEAVCSVSASCGGQTAVSGSFDCCIKVWDLDTLSSLATYRPAHAGIVWRVSCSCVDPQVFLSCGLDGKLILWDLRLPKPATICETGASLASPTAVAWHPQSNVTFALGDERGFLALRDTRRPSDVTAEAHAHSRTVFRLAFSPEIPTWVASCADETSVVVTDIESDKAKIIYRDDLHEDFVRGLAWRKSDNKLFSSGWDKDVRGHNVGNGVMETTQGD